MPCNLSGRVTSSLQLLCVQIYGHRFLAIDTDREERRYSNCWTNGRPSDSVFIMGWEPKIVSEHEYKIKFAELIHEGKRPLEAAMNIFASEMRQDSYIRQKAIEYESDEVVRKELKRLKQIVPSPQELAVELISWARAEPEKKNAVPMIQLAAQLVGILGNTKTDSKDGQDKLASLAKMVLDSKAMVS
ncbi:unnamed protein product [Sphagnum jensenii]|uniref:Uncharacterized protein n=1 Tax=Sphagnum jensenii TaxID=128206 RepID=A0ABP0V6E4_9BRYO